MQECDLSDVMRAIGNLEGTVSVGFTGINQRLDTVNGRLGKHDEKIESLDLTRSENEGKKQVLTFVGTVISGVVGLVAGLAGSFIQGGKL